MNGAPLDIRVRTSSVWPTLAASSSRFPRSTRDMGGVFLLWSLLNRGHSQLPLGYHPCNVNTLPSRFTHNVINNKLMYCSGQINLIKIPFLHVSFWHDNECTPGDSHFPTLELRHKISNLSAVGDHSSVT